MFKFKNTAPVTYQALCIAKAEQLLPGAIIEIGGGSMLLVKAIQVENTSTIIYHETMVSGVSNGQIGSSTYKHGATFTVFKIM